LLCPQCQQVDESRGRKVGLHQLAVAAEGKGRLQLAVDHGQQHRTGRDRSIVERGEALDRLGIVGSREP
jgi:hypothetical protein